MCISILLIVLNNVLKAKRNWYSIPLKLLISETLYRKMGQNILLKYSERLGKQESHLSADR